MFVVKDELWEAYCKKVGISKRDTVCKQCYEQVMGPIKIRDLKTSCNETGKPRELPANFWLIMDLAGDTSAEDLQQRLPYLKEGLRGQYLKRISESGLNLDSWTDSHKTLIRLIESELEKRKRRETY